MDNVSTLTVIDSEKKVNFDWRELWNYRELFYFFCLRDLLIRYKQTVLGVAWSVIKPISTVVVFSIVFGKLAKLPSESRIPYPVLILTALIPWQLFSNAVLQCSESIIGNGHLFTKVYFPRLIVPMSSIFTATIDSLISLLLLGLMMLYFDCGTSPRILLLPVFILLCIINATGIGLIIASLNVQFRDFRHVLPFAIQFGLYISPVGFSSSIIPEKYKFLYSLNPLVGVIDGFRWSILGEDIHFYLPGIIISILMSLALFITGVFVFQKMERSFADRI